MRQIALLAVLPLASAAVCEAAITNVRLSGTTPTQAVLSYDAPDASSCTIRVSEAPLAPTYSPVHDVDETLFAGSSSDARPGSITSGRSRVVVVGRHGMTSRGPVNVFLGRDGKRYSRALAAGTVHYFSIQCGGETYADTFTTPNIPLGNTYPEPLAADESTPGAYNWPSVVNPNSRTESFVDPNTGALIRKVTMSSESNASWNANTWPSGGMFQLCSHALVSQNAHTYNLCYVPAEAYGTLYSIETDTGNAYPLSRILAPYGQMGCPSNAPPRQVSFSASDPLRIYFVADCTDGSGPRIYTGIWVGQMNANNRVPADSGAPPNGSLQMSVLTPLGIRSLVNAFDPTYDAAMQSNLGYILLSGTQDGKLILYIVSQQDSMGWVVVFDPGNNLPVGAGGSGRVVAANATWRNGVSRWCTIHTLMPSGDHNPWISVTPNSPGRYGPAGYMGSSYAVTVANDAGSGTNGVSVIQIAPTNGSYEPQSTSTAPAYLQDAQVGDLFWVNAVGPYGVEPVEIIAKDNVNHTWTVIRGNNLGASRFLQGSGMAPGSVIPINIKAGMKLYAGCRATSLAKANFGGSGLWHWNYVLDPHGTNTQGSPETKFTYPAADGANSSQVVENYASGGHEVTRDSVNIMERWAPPDLATAWIRWDYPNGVPGPKPSFSNLINANPKFAGVSGPGLGGNYEQHPSFDQMAASQWEQSWVVDALPLRAGSNYSATGTLVAGQTGTYRMSGGAALNRKQLTTFASCGAHPLVDISSAATGNRTSDATPFTYCVANAVNECRAGSSPGDIFVGCPGANLLTCASDARTGLTDICIGDAWAYGNGAAQASFLTTDRNGGSGRLISQLFATHHQEGIYNNVRPTSDGRWLMFSTPNLSGGYATGTPETYMAKLPPFPAEESTRRDTFVPVDVGIASRPNRILRPRGSTEPINAIVEFGYAENGDPENFYCTSRQETCVAHSGDIDEAHPFYFATSEAKSITGMPCSNGCRIRVPAVPGRVLYYRVSFRDTDGDVVSTQATRVQAVP